VPEFHDKMILNAKAFSIGAAVFENLDNFAKVFRREVARRFGFELTPRDALDALTLCCLENKFDPVQDYLDGLKWDGISRIDTWLIDYCGAENTPLNRAFSRKVLMAGVRRVRQPGCKFDYILVLEGSQGAGKSSLLKILAGEENFSDTEIVGANAREQQELTRGVWIYEIGELVGLTKADVNHIKLFASKQVDSARAAYDHDRTDRKRRGIFIATTNENKYLRDTTGNRRFWPVKVRQIDLAGITADRDQLWAEAAAIEATGEPLEIPKELWSDAAAAQGERMEHDPWVDVINRQIDKLCDAVIANKFKSSYYAGKFGWGNNPNTGKGEWRVSSTYLLEEVCKLSPDRQANFHFKRLADVMTHLGWTKPPGVFRIGSAQPCYGFTISSEPEDYV
jgi:predicted P-loop ATPase